MDAAVRVERPLSERAQGGLRREIADAIAEGSRPAGMPRTRSRLRHGDRDPAPEAGERFDVPRAVAKFGEQGVIDLLGVSATTTFLAIVMNATRKGLPEASPSRSSAIRSERRM